MGMIAPLDSAFLLQEAREHPMHVAGLQLYHTPAGSTDDYVGDLYQELLQYTEVAPMFAKRPRDPVSSVGNMWWTSDASVDIEYHVRRSALPRPGRVRELLELVSRLHGSLLDRHRPLWEYHVIEGLADGRFASYAKSHHALADGVTLARKVMKGFSVDPDERGIPPMWVPRESESKSDRQAGAGQRGINPLDTLRSAGRALSGLTGIGTMLAQYGTAALVEQTCVLPYTAPKTMLNQPISGSRRVAAQSWDIARVLKAGKARGVTLNDMVLAMSAGALRRYLIAQDALPDEPLIASVPVSMRTQAGASEGNAITFVLCNLGTHLADPDERLETITASMRATKAVMADRSGLELTALGILTAVGPSALTRIPGSASMPPPYNVLISNVPGPRERLFWNGAELEAIYPLSIPTENQALNITCLSYADHLEFGLVGCRRTVPKLQRLLDYLEESLQELE